MRDTKILMRRYGPARKITLNIRDNAPFPLRTALKSNLLAVVPSEKQDGLYDFLSRLCSVYVDLRFAYLETNPLICLDAVPNSPAEIHFLDIVVKLGQTADSICAPVIRVCAPRRVLRLRATKFKLIGARRCSGLRRLHATWPRGRRISRNSKGALARLSR